MGSKASIGLSAISSEQSRSQLAGAVKIVDWMLYTPDKNAYVSVGLHADSGVTGWGGAYSEKGQSEQQLIAIGLRPLGRPDFPTCHGRGMTERSFNSREETSPPSSGGAGLLLTSASSCEET